MRVLAEFLTPSRGSWRLLAILLLCAAAGLAQAQSAANDSADPPSRVARLSYISGDLGFLPAGAKDWSDASVNRPLTRGDRLSTGRDARAELELGGGTLRMDGQTDFGLLDLNDQLTQIELTQGTLNVTVRHLDAGQSYEIDTPTVALIIDQPGTFRVDIDDNGGGTQVTAFDGGATVYGEDNAQRTINPGRSYRFVDSSLAAVAISDIDGGDAFDAWSSERDRRYAQSNSSQYVSDDVVGYQDLDQYGDWQDTSDYGAVWYPTRVAADWAPYRDGHWAYIAPWGWTWVDDSPWGFAPYHYGRWAYTHRGWGWIPGPRGMRSIYAPALVAFVGGGGWSVGIGGGPVGWFPLGPGDIYNPWYRCGRSCYTNVNIRNMRGRRGDDRRADIDDHYNRYRNGTPSRGDRYVNRDAPRGFTAVPGNTFAGGRHVQRNLVQVDQRQLATAPLVSRDANKLRPIAGGAQPSRNPRVRNLPAGGFDREVVARHAPPVMAHDVAQDARGPGRGSHLADSPRAGMPGSNIRVLNPRDNRDRGTRPFPADRAGSDRIAGDDRRRSSGTPQQLPAITRITAGTPTETHNDNRTDARNAAALPSARFVHPRGRDSADPRESIPRPGVSYISGADESRSRPAYRDNSTLPQVPQIQRADQGPGNRDVPAGNERFQHFQSNRAMRQDSPMPTAPTRNADEPRFQRAEPAPRSYVHEQPRPMPAPTRNEPKQPTFQQPHYQPAQPRAETPRPQRSESRPAQKSAPRVRDDAQQR
ncbi:hypothetical protein EAH75_11080 [Rhodanobacter glycinis]|uniref:DUF6600 domain-containing protein n=1 Tax=Rhodanobacter glycinis TaxID=582702 RepID=UPI0011277198|nr:DUF6600 domain-containing protein [Rhodanobacter glycinis]TPG47400.1 hypothetical protein EAH75_11080 [Rhodanobacter glycinis]